MSDTEKLHGVGGALAFLIYLMMVLAPIWRLVDAAGQIELQEIQYPGLIRNPEWESMKTGIWVISFPSVGFLVYAGWRLWKIHEASSVSLAKWALWISGPGSTLLAMVVFKEAEAEHILSALVPGVIAASLWTAYLTMSERVKNTYFGAPHSKSRQPADQPPSKAWLIAPPPVNSVAVKQSTPKQPAQAPVTNTPTMASVDLSHFEINEEALYEQVANEVESGNVRKGLWTKLWTEADGDDAKVRLAYIKVRVDEIKAEQAELINQSRIRAEAKKESQKRLQEEIDCISAASGVTKDEAAEMLKYGIEKVGSQFVYTSCRYDQVSDAIAYAKKRAWNAQARSLNCPYCEKYIKATTNFCPECNAYIKDELACVMSGH